MECANINIAFSIELLSSSGTFYYANSDFMFIWIHNACILDIQNRTVSMNNKIWKERINANITDERRHKRFPSGVFISTFQNSISMLKTLQMLEILYIYSLFITCCKNFQLNFHKTRSFTITPSFKSKLSLINYKLMKMRVCSISFDAIFTFRIGI